MVKLYESHYFDLQNSNHTLLTSHCPSTAVETQRTLHKPIFVGSPSLSHILSQGRLALLYPSHAFVHVPTTAVYCRWSASRFVCVVRTCSRCLCAQPSLPRDCCCLRRRLFRCLCLRRCRSPLHLRGPFCPRQRVLRSRHRVCDRSRRHSDCDCPPPASSFNCSGELQQVISVHHDSAALPRIPP